MQTLQGKTIFITGASRGIGHAIAVRAARDGANIIIAAKTSEPHPKLPGTIYSAAKDIEAAGGQALPLMVDVREEEQVLGAIAQGVAQFGGIDICVKNASSISLTGTLETPMKRYDLMHQINARGTYLCAQACLPHMIKRGGGQILNLAPPLNMNPKWFKNHVAYTMAKYGMSMCVLGMAEEFADKNICVNALWPKTGIATAAMRMIAGEESLKSCRSVEIMADAAHVILTGKHNGQFFIDEELLRKNGVTDFSKYNLCENPTLLPDFFLD